jgi:hypothetical protein
MRTALTLLVPLALALAGRTAAADPVEARLLTAPTAWLPPGGALTATASADQLGGGSAFVGLGLGDLASVEIGADSEVRTCTRCSDPADERWFPRAAFRLGARQDAWFRGMPALAIGLKNTFAARGFGAFREPRATEAYVVASRIIGPFRLHGGVAVIAAGFGDFELSPQLRPLGGFELRIASLPRSTFVGDVGWSARLEQEPEPSPRRGPRLEALFGVGARYQFFRWATIELGVRVPRDEGLAGARAMVRLNGVWELATPEKRRLELR